MPLRLRATAEANLPAVLALEADPDVAPWISGWPAARHREAISDPDQAHLTFVDGDAGVGFLLLAGLTGQNRSVELRRIALNHRGEGLGAAALGLALEHAFGTCAAHRLWLDVLPDNARALRLYERSGFRSEGLLREAHLLPDGSFTSLRLMSILKEEWARRRLQTDGSREAPP